MFYHKLKLLFLINFVAIGMFMIYSDVWAQSPNFTLMPYANIYVYLSSVNQINTQIAITWETINLAAPSTPQSAFWVQVSTSSSYSPLLINTGSIASSTARSWSFDISSADTYYIRLAARGLAGGGGQQWVGWGRASIIVPAGPNLRITGPLAVSNGGTARYYSYFDADGPFGPGNPVDVTSNTAWSSSNPGVLTINAASGLATGTAVGNAVIQGVYSGNSDIYNIEVRTAPIIRQFSADPTRVSRNGSTVLTWLTSGASSCSGNSSPVNPNWNGSVPTANVNPRTRTISNLTADTLFTLTCWASSGSCPVTQSIIRVRVGMPIIRWKEVGT